MTSATRWMKLMSAAILLATVGGLTLPMMAEDQEAPAAAGGTFSGIVVEKGGNWFRVNADDGQSMRFMPRWIGGMPAEGGGPEESILRQIKALEVGSKVTVQWIHEERPRAVKIVVTQTPPAEGVIEGRVVEKGEKWVRIQPASGSTMRFNVRWIGGEPADGGGPDKVMIEKLRKFKADDLVRVEWIREEGQRLKDIIRLESPAAR